MSAAGRVQQVMDLIDLGILKPDDYSRLLATPSDEATFVEAVKLRVDHLMAHMAANTSASMALKFSAGDRFKAKLGTQSHRYGGEVRGYDVINDEYIVQFDMDTRATRQIRTYFETDAIHDGATAIAPAKFSVGDRVQHHSGAPGLGTVVSVSTFNSILRYDVRWDAGSLCQGYLDDELTLASDPPTRHNSFVSVPILKPAPAVVIDTVVCLCCGNRPKYLTQFPGGKLLSFEARCCGGKTEARTFTQEQVAAINAGGGWTAFLS